MYKGIVNFNGQHRGGGSGCAYPLSEVLFQFESFHHMRWRAGEKPYSCDPCGDKPFGCGQCEYRSARKGGLASHMRTHTKERSYVCEHCNKRFKFSSCLNRHSRLHFGGKPYACSECDCGTKQDIECHAQLCAGEKPFRCDECNKTFKSTFFISRII